MDDAITRAEHEEFKQRLEEENRRQNRRIEILEDAAGAQTKLASSVERLATNMEAMLKEQEKQGKRLETLENRDGEMWRKVVGYIATLIAGAVIGFLLKQIGL